MNDTTAPPDSPPGTRATPGLSPRLEKAVEERFVRASGPGGQHVNKSSTAVQLRFDTRLAGLPAAVTARLLELAGSRADNAGVITIFAQSYRSQEANREDARARIAQLIEKARHRPAPRIPTRTPNSAKRKRLDTKRRQGKTKSLRGKPSSDD